MAKLQRGIKGRLFIVGSARTGTTLLQAMMANNSGVFTFPESHFFCRAIRGGRRKRWFGLANVTAATNALNELVELVGQKGTRKPARRWDPRIKSFASAFMDVVDGAALDNGFLVWLEKTPHHVDHLDEISKFVRGARFIHILRDGRDVVASQYAAQLQDPEYWRPWSIEQMAQSWGRDVSISLNHVGQKDHYFVSYSALTANAEGILRSVCQFAELDFEPGMLNHWEAADIVLGQRRREPWMQQVYRPITDTHLVKFNALFSSKQQKSVVSNLRFGGDIHNVFIAEMEKYSVTSRTHD